MESDERKCPICKVVFKEAMWCNLASDSKCPFTDLSKPTPELRDLLRMDDREA